jgi:NTP pyrophosphatase (non-canonical NTP hydrolase)
MKKNTATRKTTTAGPGDAAFHALSRSAKQCNIVATSGDAWSLHTPTDGVEIATLRGAQTFVKSFAAANGWKDFPNIDKFDHIHEELVEMSKHLRYKTTAQMRRHIRDNRDVFEDGIGDTLFALCRLCNQLGIDLESSLNLVAKRIVAKYAGKAEAKASKRKSSRKLRLTGLSRASG